MATIHDVAQRAKVSIASVSLVMRDGNTPRVGPEKRKLILKAADELGYSPSRIATALIQGETKILGLIVPMKDPIFLNYFIAQVLAGIQAAIVEEGYHLMISSHQGDTGRITAAELKPSRFADGLIVLNTRRCSGEDQAETIRELEAARIPFVMANGYYGRQRVPYVGLDDFGAGKLGAQYLIGQGHRRIGLICGAETSPMSRRLLAGFETAVRAKGSEKLDVRHAFCEYDPDRIRACVSGWMAGKQRPTAIYCADDQFVPAAYAALREAGLDIPKSVSVLGRGDTALATAIVPALTTISVPGFELGKTAAELLMGRLRDRNAPPRRVVLAGQLVERGSVARPGGAETERPA